MRLLDARGQLSARILEPFENLVAGDGDEVDGIAVAGAVGLVLEEQGDIAAILSSNVDTAIEAGVALCGEVGLSGEIRPVSRIEQRIAEAQKLGFQRILIPTANLKAVNPHDYHITIVPCRRVEDAFRALFG